MPGRGTPQRNVRIGDGLWARFVDACDRSGIKPTQAIRAFVLWYSGYSDDLPERPNPQGRD